jgi:hypothetical protein
MKNFLLVVLVSVCALAQSQATFVKGYLVNDKGDTLKGEAKVNPKKEIDNYNKIYFKDESGVQKNYKPNKIKGYGCNNQDFVSMDADGEMKFYCVLATGNINLYKLGYEAMRMNEVVFETEYYIAHSDGKDLMLVKEGKYKKQLAEWMKDNQEFINSHNEDKKFDPQTITEIITQYNAWKAAK